MSHFSVLVIGTDVDAQLARFHEFECTGTDNQYVQDIDQTQEVLDAYQEHKHDPDYPTLAAFVEQYYGIETVPHGAQPNTAGPHKFGYALLDEQGAITTVVKRTNPDKKWDWYVIGGRWDGYFTLKNGRTAAFFASGPDGGLLVFCRARLTARTRLRGYHMGVLGFCNRSEGHSEHEERALGDVHRIDTALVWVYDMASIPSDWRRRPTVATGPVPLPWVDTPCTGMAA